MGVKRRQRCMAWMMMGFIVITLAGCESNPEKSIVQEKNMDKMLTQAETKEDTSSYEQVRKEVKKYETYQTQIKDKKMKVMVDVNAKVEVPEVNKLSVYRVSASKIKEDFLNRVKKTLTPDIDYYEGDKADARTKPVIAQEISFCEKELKSAKRNDSDVVEEYEMQLADLRKEYKNAPDSVKLTDYPAAASIQKISQLVKDNSQNTFYQWLHELHGNGDVFYGVSDAKDGNYHALFLQNSPNYGNCLRYSVNKTAYDSAVYHANVENDISMIVPVKGDETPNFYDGGIIEGKGTKQETDTSAKCAENEKLTISEIDAEKKAMDLLGKLKLNDFACFDKGKYAQLLSADEAQNVYRNVWHFLYLRKLDDVFVNNQAGFKYADGWQSGSYVKKMWGSEAIAICVNDSGVVNFHYLSPLEIKETVVEQSRIKSFKEVKETFEKMVVIANKPDSEEDLANGGVSVKVTDVRLVYTRISEKDSFDTGLIVPIWDFEGTIVDEYGHEKTGNILSINAIDGSVINQELGY